MRSRDECPNVPPIGSQDHYGLGLNPAESRVREMAQNLIDDVHEHRHLRKLAVLVLMDRKNEDPGKANPSLGKHITLGKAGKVSKVQHACGTMAHFVLTINGDWFATATTGQKLALIDHELSHCGVKLSRQLVDVEHVAELEHMARNDEGHGDIYVATLSYSAQQSVLVTWDVSKGVVQPEVRKHDLEEFRGVVERWGLWKSDVKAFGETIAELPLFAAAGGEAGER
jgi:hypothetical protein